jgi:hypothetical protein
MKAACTAACLTMCLAFTSTALANVTIKQKAGGKALGTSMFGVASRP